MKLLLDVDRDEGLLYLTFCPDGKEPLSLRSVQTLRMLDGDLALDLDQDGHLVGLELRDPNRVGWEAGESVEIDGLVGVKEAAALLGMQKSNFVRDVAKNPAFPKPLAAVASGPIWLRSDVLRYAERQGRPTAEGTLGSWVRRYVKAKGSIEDAARELGATVDVTYRITQDRSTLREVSTSYLVDTYGLSPSSAKKIQSKVKAFGHIGNGPVRVAARKE